MAKSGDMESPYLWCNFFFFFKLTSLLFLYIFSLCLKSVELLTFSNVSLLAILPFLCGGIVCIFAVNIVSLRNTVSLTTLHHDYPPRMFYLEIASVC